MNDDDNGTPDAGQGVHTPGPAVRTFRPDGSCFFSLGLDGPYKSFDVSLDGSCEWDRADARRIVATWNACDGIPTEALEAGVIGDMVEVMMWASPVVEAALGADDDFDLVIEDYRAAIAKLEGKL